MLHVKIDSTEAERGIANLASRLRRPVALLKSWGNRLAQTARGNARAKGGRRFWREIADRTRMSSVSESAVIVSCDHVAAAQKQFGGDIRPKNRRALTIPIADEARGKTAGEFAAGGRSLFVLESDKADTIGVLGYNEAGGEFHPLFVLRSRVSQRPEPFWPEAQEIGRIGLAEATFWVDRELRAAAGRA